MKESFFKFNEPHLMSFSYQENSDFQEELFQEMQFSFETNIRDNPEEHEAFISIRMTIGDEVTNPFLLTAEMGALFSWDSSEDNEMIEALKKNNAPSLLISYIRPIVTVITSASRFPVLNIPFMDLRDDS